LKSQIQYQCATSDPAALVRRCAAFIKHKVLLFGHPSCKSVEHSGIILTVKQHD